MTNENHGGAKKARENPWVGLLLSLVIPIIILKKFSGESQLGPLYGMILAVAFPIAHGVYEFTKSKKIRFIPILGMVNVLLTGGIVLFEVGGIWFAVKEAAVPGLIGCAIWISDKIDRPLVKALFFNDQILNLERINVELNKATERVALDREFVIATHLIATSFLISAALNFGFAYFLVTSAPGTEAFNDEVGTMQGLSFGAILVCCTSLMMYALYRVFREIRQLTGLAWEDMIRQH